MVLTNPGVYWFPIIVWATYLANSFYLNYKTKRFFHKSKAEGFLSIPFYVFFATLTFETASHIIGLSDKLIKPDTNIASILIKAMGALFCLAATLVFTYLAHSKATFPSCLYIERGESLKGIYNYVRHPSYVVFFLLTFGTSLYLMDIALFLLSALLYISLYFSYMIEERQYLRTVPGYKEYFDKTNRFLPKFSLIFSAIIKRIKT